MHSDGVEKVAKITRITDKNSDFAFWQSQSHVQRLEALEEIRVEYTRWKYGAEQGFQRVYRVTQFK